MSATETLERAITIHQPWAWAVAAGHKPVENRTWRPPLEAVGKLIGIHAGKTCIPEREWHKVMPVDVVERAPAGVTCGALIGVARLVGVVRQVHTAGTGAGHILPDFERMLGRAVTEPLSWELCARIRPWWRGPWGWLFGEAVLLPEPIPMRGQQGLWRIPGRPTDGRLHREWQAFDRGMEAYSAGHGRVPPPPPTANLWALEQWRKARETR